MVMELLMYSLSLSTSEKMTGRSLETGNCYDNNNMSGRWPGVIRPRAEDENFTIFCPHLPQVTGFLHKVRAELGQLPLVSSETELAIVDIDKLRELIVGALTALPEVLAKDVGQVGQVLDPHHSV